MPTYDVVVVQRVRYSVTVDAENPEAAIAHIDSGAWDDTDNMVTDETVAVHDAAGVLVAER